MTTLPAGWMLVPIEPTPEMTKAWHDTYSKAVIKTGRSNRAYAAMLAAAPSAASVAPGDAQDVYHFEQRSRFGPWVEVEKPTAQSVEFVKRSDAPAAGDALEAARYRWLRSKSVINMGYASFGLFSTRNRDTDFLCREEGLQALDAAIDAALAAQVPQQGEA